MELICPSCEARYQVPETSIGEKGRQVSCMNCGHSWHAFPPLVLGSSGAPSAAASPGIDYQTPPRPGRSSSAPAYAETESAPTPSARAPEPPRLSDASRSEQLAEIREMLAEVQSEERAAAALTPDDDYRSRIAPAPKPEQRATRAATAIPPAPILAEVPVAPPSRDAISLPDPQEDEDQDPLRRRMAMHEKQSESRTDVDRLRKRHDRRSRRSQRARETGSGAFLTGFLLVVMIAAVMTAIYMLQPQIAQRMPGTEPMLADYVEAIDGMRLRVAEGYESARTWLLGLFENA